MIRQYSVRAGDVCTRTSQEMKFPSIDESLGRRSIGHPVRQAASHRMTLFCGNVSIRVKPNEREKGRLNPNGATELLVCFKFEAIS